MNAVINRVWIKSKRCKRCNAVLFTDWDNENGYYLNCCNCGGEHNLEGELFTELEHLEKPQGRGKGKKFK